MSAGLRRMPSHLNITRAPSFIDSNRAYRIMVDGEMVGRILPQETVEIPIKQGQHDISVRIDWCGSRKLSLKFEPDDTLFLECGSNVSGWKFILNIVYIAFFWNDYLWLRQKSPARKREKKTNGLAFNPCQSPASFTIEDSQTNTLSKNQ